MSVGGLLPVAICVTLLCVSSSCDAAPLERLAAAAAADAHLLVARPVRQPRPTEPGVELNPGQQDADGQVSRTVCISFCIFPIYQY